MNHGLSAATVATLHAVFARFPEIEKALLYGSRAKGNYKPGSDIDLTLIGQDLTRERLGRIMSALDDALLPYTVDLSIYALLANSELREHIDRVGRIFYERLK
ncbi:MAG: hypothetical protein A2293_01035 [Elusimicrobia bacterium RIFOXYB2_FULL_49_7]|nr:MAG: hypothetical protein A2293_01035 [Elusimicrobia bacterium RIFOXYB2_FULL_49_7]